MRLPTFAENYVQRRQEAFGRPIVVVRMSRAQYDQALRDGNEVEAADLVSGVRSGQIVIGETP